MNKKIVSSTLGLTGIDVSKALGLPPVYPLGYNHKKERKKKKNRMRELARRQKRLDKINDKLEANK
ncbi:MAG TPA: hypothetical protein EYN67_14905 [Flavobacteriales bacterium]|nr:hypothetical protein [Flavobacteriales bacterium]